DKLHRLIRSNEDHWAIPMDLPEEYFSHLTAEQKVQEVEKRSGKVKFTWRCVPPGAANHGLDCEVYQLAAAELLQLETAGAEGAQEDSAEPMVVRGDVF
ncbi:MAG: terminase gpA endonuclease subunit, partial [Rhodothermales bacterium]|nr:terminase gpA endonuclease subunit [Rhodothermales bacterium]